MVWRMIAEQMKDREERKSRTSGWPGESGTMPEVWPSKNGRFMERELTFRIVLEKPPAGVDFALQKGRGGTYETIQKQRSGDGDLRFEFSARAKAAIAGEAPNLLGPFVQGPPDGRFVYLDIGAYAGQTGTSWGRRLKIPLSGITTEVVSQLAGHAEAVLETHVPGTGRDGGPNCGTVKPFGGWKLVQLSRK
jgi:hypothetical protein